MLNKNRFIKFIPSDEAMWLLKERGHAFRLLTIIAESARRYEGDPDGLKIGECYIGGFEKYDMTEQNYRTAKNILVKRQHLQIIETCRNRKKSTTGVTTVGTKVKILSSDVWDINLEGGNDRSNDCLTTDQRPTNDKQERQECLRKNKTTNPTLPSTECELPGVVGSVVLSVCFFDCLLSVQISDDDKRKLTAMFVESDVIRAVAVLQSQKTAPRNVMGFLIAACRKQFAPKENASHEIILSARAQTNKATIFQFRDTFAQQLSIKDLRITDMLDHLTFGHLKIFYESENFNQDVGKALEHFNLLHLIHKEKPMPIIEEKIICFKNAAQMAHEIINVTQRIDDEQL